MLRKLILAIAVVGLIGAAAGTASAQGYGRRGYCPRPTYYNTYGPAYGRGYSYGGPSTYFGPQYGFRINGASRGFGYGYPYRGGYGYGYGRSGVSIRIGF